MSKLVSVFDGKDTSYLFTEDVMASKGNYVFFNQGGVISAGVVENVLSLEFLCTEKAKYLKLPLSYCEEAKGIAKELCMLMVEKKLEEHAKCANSPTTAPVNEAVTEAKMRSAIKKDSQSYKMYGKRVRDFTKSEMYNYKKYMKLRLMAK